MCVGSGVLFLETNVLTNCLLKPSRPHKKKKKLLVNFPLKQVTPVTLRTERSNNVLKQVFLEYNSSN